MHQTWQSRLRIFRRLFPWVNQTIKEWAGLPPDKPTDQYSHEDNLAFLAASREYEKGYRSDRPEVKSLHDRQNTEWTTLTKLPPLGTMEDWRAAAWLADISGDEFESMDFKEVEKRILAWAKAERVKAERVKISVNPVADWAQMSHLNWPEHLKTAVQRARFLDDRKEEIPSESKGRRRYVEANAFYRYWAKQNLKSFESLDGGQESKPVIPESVETAQYLENAVPLYRQVFKGKHPRE